MAHETLTDNYVINLMIKKMLCLWCTFQY